VGEKSESESGISQEYRLFCYTTIERFNGLSQNHTKRDKTRVQGVKVKLNTVFSGLTGEDSSFLKILLRF